MCSERNWYEIIGGPGELDIALSLLHWGPKVSLRVSREPHSEATYMHEPEVMINELLITALWKMETKGREHKKVRGHKFGFVGMVDYLNDKSGVIWTHVMGEFDSHTRRGWLRPVSAGTRVMVVEPDDQTQTEIKEDKEDGDE